MNKILVSGLCVLLSCSHLAAKVSANSIEKNIKQYKKELPRAIHAFIRSGTIQKLQKIKQLLPSAPQKTDHSIEKDVFTLDIEKSKATLEILERQIKLLKRKRVKKQDHEQHNATVQVLEQLFTSQQKIAKKWEEFIKE